MSRFLLDENLSPRVGYALSNQFGFDVVSILKLNMARTPDREIGVFARETGRVLITLDEDFATFFNRSAKPPFGVIYLDISNDFRYNNEIIMKLSDFFQNQAHGVDLEHSLVIINDFGVTINPPTHS